MKQNLSKKVVGFILKYIWIFCLALIILEVTSTMYSANVLMQQTAKGIMESAGGEVSGRVDGVLRLLTGLSHDERFMDTDVPLFDRAMQTKPYKESYNLFMIAITDENVNVISSNEIDPNPEPYSLAHRDYMQRLYADGEPQITDAFRQGPMA